MPLLCADFWHGRDVVVLGAARSGVAAARFLQQRGNQVFVSDAGRIAEDIKQELAQCGIAWEEGQHTPERLQQAAAMVVSPGIPLSAPPFALAAEKKIPVISEIELAGQFLKVPVLALTGSNGKTTTAILLHALLQAAGFRTGLGGNIGTPLISLVDQPLDWIVAEISSFQLETTFTFRPRIGLFLNLYPNHLDRHGTMEHYFALKSRLFQAQHQDDLALANRDNLWCQRLPECLERPLQWFAHQADTGVLAWMSGQHFFRQGLAGPEVVMSVAELPLLGSHNHENYLAMLAVSAYLDVPLPAVRQAVGSVSGIPHRVEKIAIHEGRCFINDSKATNYLATMKAIESLSHPLILIAGGLDKGGDFGPLAALIQRRVKHVVLLGAAAPRFAFELNKIGYHFVSCVDSLTAAVAKAWECSLSGDAILLSPACASYDMFANFEERGACFTTCVAELCTSVPVSDGSQEGQVDER